MFARLDKFFCIGQGYQKCIDLDHCLFNLSFNGASITHVLLGYIVRNNLAAAKLAAGWPTGSGPLPSWRRPRTKVRNLMKLGVPLDLAIACGISSKSYWRSAKTEGIHRALSNEFFAEKGLLSLRDRWV